MNKRSLIIIIIIIVIVLISLVVYQIFKNKNNNIITLFGNIEIRQVDLSFQVSGIIKDVFVEEGDYVKKGQLLAQLDDKDYKANYDKALQEEKNLYFQNEEDLSKFNRNHPLCRDNIISAQECVSLFNKKEMSKAKYLESKANRTFQRNQLNYTKLYASQDVIISTRAQEKGARVSAGQIIYVENLPYPIWVRTYIKETDLGNIKYGQKAKILTDTIDIKTNKKKEYEGFVGYISPVAEFTPKTVQTQDLRADLVYRIRVYIYDVDEYLRQGMPVTIVFDLNEDKKDDKLYKDRKISKKI